jgi:hypothetical protein
VHQLLVVAYVLLGPVGFVAITAVGWRVERSGPLPQTRSARFGLGVLLLLSAAFTVGGGYLALLSISD